MEKAKILLLGDNFRSALAVSETLAQNGFEVHILGWWSIPLDKSRWVTQYHCIPRWDLNIAAGKTAFEKVLSENKFQALIPVNDDALEMGAVFNELILKYTLPVGFPPQEKWIFARDKSALLQKFEELGLGGPQSMRIEQLSELKENLPFDFPLIIKPCSSRHMEGETLQSASVQKIENAAAWENWKNSHPVLPVMIQEFIGGRELGFNFYAENGEIIHHYIDEQLHGRIGNEASYRRIAPLPEAESAEITEVFSKFITSVGWDGIGMFDFKFDRGKVFVIEFNGRFWASIQLSKHTGSDLAQLFVSRKLLHVPLHEIRLVPSGKGSLRNFKSDLKFAVTLLKRKEFGAFFSWIYSLKNTFRCSERIEDSLFRDIKFRMGVLKWQITKFVRR